jgi:hypothetical protein
MSEITNDVVNTENIDADTDVNDDNATRTYEDIGPFAAHYVVNLRLQEEGIDKEIAGPQMYNAAKNGAVKSNYHTRKELPNGKLEPVMLDGADFKRWLDAYVQKLQSGGTGRGADYAKLAEQYR